MGNVVSSLMMYALQAAWFCQRLIDQDYRQNHGSRSKPIMGIHETDLDVFLSKCRNYYLSKTNRSIQYGGSGASETMRKRPHRESIATADGSAPQWSVPDDLNFDSDLSKTDEKVSLRGDFAQLIIDKNDLERFLSNSCELPGGRVKCDSPKTERRKRKRVYYRGRFNPRRSNRSCLSSPANSEALPVDVWETNLSAPVNGREIRVVPESIKGREVSPSYDCPRRETESIELAEEVSQDLVVVIQKMESECLPPRGADRNVMELVLAREC